MLTAVIIENIVTIMFIVGMQVVLNGGRFDAYKTSRTTHFICNHFPNTKLTGDQASWRRYARVSAMK